MKPLVIIAIILTSLVNRFDVPDKEICSHEYIQIHEEFGTCTTNHYIDYECIKCNNIKTDITDLPHSHIYNKKIIEEPTCITNGKEKYTCKKCKQEKIEEIHNLGHNYTKITVDSTYNTEGYDLYTCIRCNEEYKDNYMPILLDIPGEWIYSDWEIKKNNSCIEDGYRERIKSRTYTSGKIETEIETDIINKSGHKLTDWELIKEPTCYEDGYEERKCYCGYNEINILSKLEHSFSDWQNIKKATCWENGIDNRICNTCQHIEERYLDKLTHKYNHISHTDSTTQVQGKDIYECEYCKHTYETLLPLITNEWIYNIEQKYKNEINQADNIYKGNNLYIIEKEKSFYHSNHVHVAHIFVRNPATQIGIEFANGGLTKDGRGCERPSNAAKRLNVPFLINSSGYDVTTGIMGDYERFVAIYNSKAVNSDSIDLNQRVWASGLYLTQSGQFVSAYGKSNQEIIDSNYKASTYFAGTRIVKDYQFNPYRPGIDYSLYAPRTGIGIVNDNEFYVVVASYYNYTHGVSLEQFANIFIQLGCRDAYNVDGGGSSTMVMNNKIINVLGSVDGPVERAVSSFIWFKD